MFEFTLPDLGEGIHEGELIKWYVKEGDTINEDDPLCDIETDKATVTIPSPRTGTIVQINGEPGEVLAVNSVLVVIKENGSQEQDSVEDSKVPKTYKPGIYKSGTYKPGQSEKPSPIVSKISSVDSHSNRKAIAAPATRRLAREMGIDINQVTGSGPGRRVTKDDLDGFSNNESNNDQTSRPVKQLKPIVPGGIPFFEVSPLPDYEKQGPVEKEPIRSLRKKTAIKTTSSMIQIPHVAHMDECDVTELESLRKTHNEKNVSKEKLTLLGFIIRAVASLLQKYPAFNSSVDTEKMEIIYKHFYHIGFAADTPKGLMVPVVKNADKKDVIHIAKEVRKLAKKGRDGSITLPELSHGTFTITNVGAIGGTGVVPIINIPEAAILGMGRVAKKPVVRDDEIVIRKMLPITLCFDHRVADGAQAAHFVTQLKQMLEDPFVFMTGI